AAAAAGNLPQKVLIPESEYPLMQEHRRNDPHSFREPGEIRQSREGRAREFLVTSSTTFAKVSESISGVRCAVNNTGTGSLSRFSATCVDNEQSSSRRS
ncbi:hypothetical protein HN011_011736, partial [Eciton burchellii]